MLAGNLATPQIGHKTFQDFALKYEDRFFNYFHKNESVDGFCKENPVVYENII